MSRHIVWLVCSSRLCANCFRGNAEQLSPPSATPINSTDPALADFDAFVEAQLKKWNTPSVAITVVRMNLETAVDRSDCSEKPVFIDVAGFLHAHQLGESATHMIAQF